MMAFECVGNRVISTLKYNACRLYESAGCIVRYGWCWLSRISKVCFDIVRQWASAMRIQRPLALVTRITCINQAQVLVGNFAYEIRHRTIIGFVVFSGALRQTGVRYELLQLGVGAVGAGRLQGTDGPTLPPPEVNRVIVDVCSSLRRSQAVVRL